MTLDWGLIVVCYEQYFLHPSFYFDLRTGDVVGQTRLKIKCSCAMKISTKLDVILYYDIPSWKTEA